MSTRPWRELPRQDGRRFVVTGASGGIGLETAMALAARGAHVLLAVRSLERGRAAAAQMEGAVDVARLDVADLASVRTFAAEVGEVDVLVNNAGALALPFSTSPDGVELHFATNHLGHFALTNCVGPHRLREMDGWPTGVGRSQQALDPDLARALWAESERLSGVGFPLSSRS